MPPTRKTNYIIKTVSKNKINDIIVKKTKCPNKLCNHKKDNKFIANTPVFSITLEYLIRLGNMYHCKNFKEYNKINLYDLCNIISYLTELNEMIGMAKIKLSIVEQLFYFLKGNYKVDNDCKTCYSCKSNEKNYNKSKKNIITPLLCEKKQKNPLHFILLGPPGTGKTQTAKIIGKIYSTLGLLSKGTFKMINATDCHSGNIGETSQLLNQYIQASLGGCLFIDEIYGIGNGGDTKNSITVREFVNTLIPALTNYSDLAIGIAGYKKSVEDNIFAINEGFRGRFMFTYELEAYSPNELFLIFEKMIKNRYNYILFSNDNNEYKKYAEKCILLFEQNKIYITDNGRDIESIVHYTLSSNSVCENIIFDQELKKTYITYSNVKTAIEKFILNKKSITNEGPPISMYT